MQLFLNLIKNIFVKRLTFGDYLCMIRVKKAITWEGA